MKNIPLNRILYINMDKHTDRNVQLLQRLKEYTRGKWPIERVRGVEVAQSDINRYIKVDSKYLSPIKNRRPTLGELGCASSHIKAWRRVVELGEPCLILEDDVQSFSHNFLADLHGMWTDALDAYFPEFIYLGRQAHHYSEETPFTNQFRVPKFSWLLHAYWLSPNGAKKLLETPFIDNLFVVDDYVPIMLGHGPDIQLDVDYSKYPKLKALALENALFYQLEPIGPGRSANSATENSPVVVTGKRAEDTQYGLATVATDPKAEGYKILEESAKANGWDFFRNVGSGHDWSSGDMTGPGGIDKIKIMRDVVDSVYAQNPEAIVFFCDGYDVFLTKSPNEAVQTWLDNFDEEKVLFGCEHKIWPTDEDGWRTQEYLKLAKDKNWPRNFYLNSGLYVGRARTLKKLFESIRQFDKKQFNDDQELMQFAHLHSDLIEMDVHRKLFLNLSDCEEIDAFLTPNNEISFRELEDRHTYPAFIHGNGGPRIKNIWKMAWKNLKEYRDPQFIGKKRWLKIVP
jgi:hypothetical protein